MRTIFSNGLVTVFAIIMSSLALSEAPALELQGEFIQGGLVFGRASGAVEVRLEKQAVALTPDGEFSLGFDRDAPAVMLLRARWPDGREQQRSLSIKQRDYVIQRVNGIAQKIMNPSADDLTRIRADAVLVKRAREQVIARKDFQSPFQWPLAGPITGVFGSQRVYNGVPGRPHYGVDVAAKVGTPLTTPAAGVVTLAHHDLFYSGGTLIIDHGYGLSSTLMHLSKVLVTVGDEVKPGDIVAEVGATGRATGPHLDWRMNWNSARIDPQLLVAPIKKTQPRTDNSND